jgi:hypothetical protein
MNESYFKPNWNLYTWLAAAGLILFLIVQVIPSTAETFFGTGSEEVIGKSAAERAAAEFALARFKQMPESMETVHQSDSLLYGYLEKEKLSQTYEKKYDVRFPTDTYQVNAQMPDGTNLFIYVHMQKGSAAAWSRHDNKRTTVPSPEEQRNAAIDFAESQGFKTGELKLRKQNAEDGTVRFDVEGYAAGEAKLELEIRTATLEDGSVRIDEYKPKFIVPAAYESYVKQQTKLASWLSLIGSLFLSFVLFVLAIVYACLYRKHTSFIRGIVLSVVFLVLYIANNFNMKGGILAGYGEDPNAAMYAAVAIGITCVITAVMAVSVYFSLVAGDGLWRAMGRNLWPRYGEPGYGGHVWQSMWLGYLVAFMLLGAQTAIFLVLMKVTGAWSTTDVTQSPYNFAWPWVFPVLAWCAAISEEAVYRLFGIGLMRKWFKNTFAASLIPTIIWALGHVTYPIFPSTTRLIELTIIGLIFSFLFVRFGFVTVLFAHAIFDSTMMAISLILLGGTGNIALGVVYILLPIPIAWLIQKLDRRRPIEA